MQKKISTVTRSVIWEKQASLAVLDVSAVAAEAKRRHNLSPLATAAFARVIVCAAYLCSWIEEGQELSLVLGGEGPLGRIFAFGNGKLHLCGYVENPLAGELGGDVAAKIREAVGSSGSITVTLDGGSGLPFSGSVCMTNGNISADMEEYFKVSEQRPTAISLFEEERDGQLLCGGVFVQPLTGAPPEIYQRAQALAAECTSFSKTQVLLREFIQHNGEVREVSFACGCSRKKAENALLTVGFQAAMDCLRTEGAVVVHCPKCNGNYTFGEKEIRTLFRKEP